MAYLLHHEAGSNTQHIFFPMRMFFVCLFVLFCLVFLVNKINVRSCVSPTATTRQTPVGVFSFYFLTYFNFKKKSLLLACPTHANKEVFYLILKHIDNSTQLYLLYNEAGSKTQHIFTMVSPWHGIFKDVVANTQHIILSSQAVSLSLQSVIHPENSSL